MLGIFYWTFCAWIIDSVMCIRFGKCDVAALWINAYVCECDWTVMNDNIELHFTQQNGQVRQFSIVKLAILFRSLWQQQHNFWQTLLSQRKFFSLSLPLSFSLHVQFNFQMNCVCVCCALCTQPPRPPNRVKCFYARNARCIFNSVSVWFTQCAFIGVGCKLFAYYRIENSLSVWEEKPILLELAHGDVIQWAEMLMIRHYIRQPAAEAIHQTMIRLT